jgi:hypothetical protein
MNLRVSGSLSAHHQEFLAVHRHWYILCSFDDRLLPGEGWNYRIFYAVLMTVCCQEQDGRKGCPKHVES